MIRRWITTIALLCLSLLIFSCNNGDDQVDVSRVTPGNGGSKESGTGNLNGADDDNDPLSFLEFNEAEIDRGLLPCVEPKPGMTIQSHARIQFCPSSFRLPTGGTFAIAIEGRDIEVSGYGTELVGDAEDFPVGIALLLNDVDGLIINGLTFRNYGTAIGHSALGISGANIRIQDIEISKTSVMYVELSGKNIEFRDAYVHDATGGGIFLNDCRKCRISNVFSKNINRIIESNIVIASGGENVIEENTIFTRNSLGCNSIWLDNTEDNIIRDNTIDNGFKDGSHFTRRNVGNAFYGNIFVSAEVWQQAVWINQESSKNQFYNNTFDTGLFIDEGSKNDFCTGTSGNVYLNGARYEGPDQFKGTCPESR